MSELPPEGASLGSRAGSTQPPIAFEPNLGQAPAGVDFVARAGDATMALTGSETLLSLPGSRPVRIAFVGTSEPPADGVDRLQGVVNYYVGADASTWLERVPTYGAVRYRDLYPAIDVVFHSRNGTPEYDFVLSPGADPEAIQLRIRGAGSIRVDGRGDLVLDRPAGKVRQRRPFVYQRMPSGRLVRVDGRYVLAGRTVRFDVGPYDRSVPLVIDPQLIYSTFLGGQEFDQGNAIAVDQAGNAYVTGVTFSSDLPISGGALQPTDPDPGVDAFVARFSPTGARLYSTYLGGADPPDQGSERASGIAADASGASYVTGSTLSGAFPTSPGAFQATDPDPGQRDAFVTKLSSSGTLAYSTYLGGNVLDDAFDVDVDPSGNAYVTGETLSTDFPTKNPVQASRSGLSDAFAVELKPDGSGLVFSTYLGGSDVDSGTGIVVDPAFREFYITGRTFSTDFPTVRAIQGDRALGDAFITSIGPAGAGGIQFSTYLGGSGFDGSEDIAFGPGGETYVTGSTGSSDFPLRNARQSDQGSVDAFITKLAVNGTGLMYSTYLGGTGRDEGAGIAVDAQRNAYVSGLTDSPDFPVARARQQSLGGGVDAFLTVLGPTGQDLVHSTFHGGAGGDRSSGVDVDTKGNAHLVGHTSSPDFPRNNAFQPAFQGKADAFVSRISTFRLNVVIQGNGAVSSSPAGIGCPGDCLEDFANRQVITLSATPAQGAALQSWQGCVPDPNVPTRCTVAMTQSQTVTAVFVGNVGRAKLSPQRATVRPGEHLTYGLAWFHPVAWRELDSIELSRRPGLTALRVRWNEEADTFQIRDPDGGWSRPIPGGSDEVLETLLARLFGEGTVSEAVNTTVIALRIEVAFRRAVAGESYRVEVRATDDRGNIQPWERVGHIRVLGG